MNFLDILKFYIENVYDFTTIAVYLLIAFGFCILLKKEKDGQKRNHSIVIDLFDQFFHPDSRKLFDVFSFLCEHEVCGCILVDQWNPA